MTLLYRIIISMSIEWNEASDLPKHIHEYVSKKFKRELIWLIGTGVILMGCFLFPIFFFDDDKSIFAIMLLTSCFIIYDLYLITISLIRMKHLKSNNFDWREDELDTLVTPLSKRGNLYKTTSNLSTRYYEPALTGHPGKKVYLLEIPKDNGKSYFYHPSFSKSSCDLNKKK